MSRMNSSIAMAGGLSLYFAFSSVAYASGSLPILEVESHFPLKLSVFEQGKSYGLSPPGDFMREIEDVYEDVHVEDLTGDGVGEVVFNLGGGRVNACSRVLHYTDSDRSLSELMFSGGGLCDFKIRHGYVISSYKDGAVWAEDVYVVKGGKAYIKISDRCVGCGEIVRKEYLPDGSFVRLLVSDEVDFEKRTPLIAKVASLQAWIFSSLGAAQPTRKYLIRGDEVTILGGGKARGEEWIEFRFSGSTTTEGWLKCSDLDGCNEF